MVEIYNQTATIASIAPGATVTVSFPAATIASTGSYTTIASVELAGDKNTANDSVQGTLTVIPAFSGSYSVGTGETITSLTNTGGIFEPDKFSRSDWKYHHQYHIRSDGGNRNGRFE